MTPSRLAKRLIDLVVAATLLVVLSPLMLVAGFLTWLGDRGPVLYRQQRAGYRGRPYAVMKFRSMRVNQIAPETLGQVGTSHTLVTPVGRVLRRFKVDELPQLANVLRGEMSLVGPRPTLLSQAQEYDAFAARRLDVPPGLTGWAQVNGNVELTWAQRIQLDVWYVDHWSLSLDAAILWRTMYVVLGGERPNAHAIRLAEEHANRADRGG
jgi:lipopolysaccharide/colanic/teichoic acid biosynthesis glycosyltransferase